MHSFLIRRKSGSYDAEYYVCDIYCGAITLSLKAAADALVSISLDAGSDKPGEPGGVLAQLANAPYFKEYHYPEMT